MNELLAKLFLIIMILAIGFILGSVFQMLLYDRNSFDACVKNGYMGYENYKCLK